MVQELHFTLLELFLEVRPETPRHRIEVQGGRAFKHPVREAVPPRRVDPLVPRMLKRVDFHITFLSFPTLIYLSCS